MHYKIGQMVLGDWGSVNLSHLFTYHLCRNSASLIEKGEVDPQVGTYIIFAMVFRSHASIL